MVQRSLLQSMASGQRDGGLLADEQRNGDTAF